MYLNLRCLNIQVLVVVLLCLVVCCSTCFIRNCPPGGKRSLEQVADFHTDRKCLRCGPRGLGQCIGPNICCGSGIGCYMNTIESAGCAKENDIRTPCNVEGSPCGPAGDGRCVAYGVCCNDGKCSLDHTCEDDLATESRAGSSSPDLMRMLRQWLDKRSFTGRK